MVYTMNCKYRTFYIAFNTAQCVKYFSTNTDTKIVTTPTSMVGPNEYPDKTYVKQNFIGI